jgi:hypothetical protein
MFSVWTGKQEISLGLPAEEFTLCQNSTLQLWGSPVHCLLRLLPRKWCWQSCEFGHSPPCITEVKNGWSYKSTPPYAFINCNGTNLLVSRAIVEVMTSVI